MDPNQDPPVNLEPNTSHLIRNVLFIAFFIFVVLVGVNLFIVFRNLNNAVNKSISQLAPASQATVALKKEYGNPFDKNTQYSNPFSVSQNPFDNLAQ